MRELTEDEIKQKLKMSFWDANLSLNELYNIFINNIASVHSIDRTKVFARLLSSYDWYTILQLIPPDKLKEALDDKVLQSLWPKSLAKRYYYARRILFE